MPQHRRAAGRERRRWGRYQPASRSAADSAINFRPKTRRVRAPEVEPRGALCAIGVSDRRKRRLLSPVGTTACNRPQPRGNLRGHIRPQRDLAGHGRASAGGGNSRRRGRFPGPGAENAARRSRRTLLAASTKGDGPGTRHPRTVAATPPPRSTPTGGV